MAFMGRKPQNLPHWEHWSCPDAETTITGIDYYEHPRLCRQKLVAMYPRLAWSLGVPDDDTPKPRPRLDLDGHSSDPGKHTVRWGDGESAPWSHGEAFRSAEDVFAYSPLEHAHESLLGDVTSEETLYRNWRKLLPAEWGDRAPEGSTRMDCYNHFTMFMWPLMTFGYELFLETCLDERFDRIMDEFAEINRRVFRALARMPQNFILCHDDIVNTRGPVCSPAWMRRHIFSRYEEFFGIVRDAGKQVIFMTDGCVDAFADDIFACGARGIITEPYTDFRAIARKHENCFLAGEGDNRVLMRSRPEEIRAMVEGMVETARMTGGYMMCVGNHIPWNVPPKAVQCYLDLCEELAHR